VLINMKKFISIYSILLFIIPLTTLIYCHQLHVAHTGIQTFPFIDGQVSVSLIGRQGYSIGIFKPAFFLYSAISVLFYFKISNFFQSYRIKNKFKFYCIISNFFLCIYIITLGERDSTVYEILRRLSIILYIVSMYINHIYLTKILWFLRSNKIIQFNIAYLIILYVIIFLMSILIIIGSPWVNPLFEYPYDLKNIVEWNYFFLMISFYVPLSILFHKNNM